MEVYLPALSGNYDRQEGSLRCYTSNNGMAIKICRMYHIKSKDLCIYRYHKVECVFKPKYCSCIKSCCIVQNVDFYVVDICVISDISREIRGILIQNSST